MLFFFYITPYLLPFPRSVFAFHYFFFLRDAGSSFRGTSLSVILRKIHHDKAPNTWRSPLSVSEAIDTFLFLFFCWLLSFLVLSLCLVFLLTLSCFVVSLDQHRCCLYVLCSVHRATYSVQNIKSEWAHWLWQLYIAHSSAALPIGTTDGVRRVTQRGGYCTLRSGRSSGDGSQLPLDVQLDAGGDRSGQQHDLFVWLAE